jgi:DNA-binding NtrC family response regulator
MGSRNILLLSDGSQIFTVLSQFFTNEGCHTLTTDTLQAAVQALRGADFQLLITRIRPDRPEPLSLLKALRRRHPRLTAIILRGEHEVNSPLEACHLEDGEEVFNPCGWPGLWRLVASCLPH